MSRQYLDNTSNKNRSLNPYYTQDVNLSYQVTKKPYKELTVFVQLYNLFSKLYEANGYSYSYIYNSTLNTSNYYFPMAPINFMTGINIKL